VERAWLEEFLHATFPRLPELDGHSLANVTWGLAKLGARPPPAWLYALCKAAGARMAASGLNRRDLAGLSRGLHMLNDGPSGMQLPKVEELLADIDAAAAELLQQHGSTSAHMRGDAASGHSDALPGVDGPVPVNGVHHRSSDGTDDDDDGDHGDVSPAAPSWMHLSPDAPTAMAVAAMGDGSAVNVAGLAAEAAAAAGAHHTPLSGSSPTRPSVQQLRTIRSVKARRNASAGGRDGTSDDGS
jgi:hypothetical protein